MDKKDTIIERLAKEYLSKCNACDECFCSCYCTIEQLRYSRKSTKECWRNIVSYFNREEKI